MAISIKEYIMQNLQETVRNVKRKDGYDNDIDSGLVYRARGSVNTNMFPSVYIFEGDSDVNGEEAGSNPSIKIEMEVAIEFWCKSYDEMGTLINSLEADITKAVMADTTRGGYAEDTNVGSSTPFFDDVEKVGGRIVTFIINYWVREADPYTAGG